jgi:hypothetical protein
VIADRQTLTFDASSLYDLDIPHTRDDSVVHFECDADAMGSRSMTSALGGLTRSLPVFYPFLDGYRILLQISQMSLVQDIEADGIARRQRSRRQK